MPKMVPLRKTFDHHLNNHGKILLEYCKSLDGKVTPLEQLPFMATRESVQWTTY